MSSSVTPLRRQYEGVDAGVIRIVPDLYPSSALPFPMSLITREPSERSTPLMTMSSTGSNRMPSFGALKSKSRALSEPCWPWARSNSLARSQSPAEIAAASSLWSAAGAHPSAYRARQQPAQTGSARTISSRHFKATPAAKAASASPGSPRRGKAQFGSRGVDNSDSDSESMPAMIAHMCSFAIGFIFNRTAHGVPKHAARFRRSGQRKPRSAEPRSTHRAGAAAVGSPRLASTTQRPPAA